MGEAAADVCSESFKAEVITGLLSDPQCQSTEGHALLATFSVTNVKENLKILCYYKLLGSILGCMSIYWCISCTASVTYILCFQ